MSYSIVLEKPAQKFLKRLSKEEKSKILKALQKLPKGDLKAMQGTVQFDCVLLLL